MLEAVLEKNCVFARAKSKTPNEKTLEAMREVEDMIRTGKGKSYISVEELLEDLNEDEFSMSAFEIPNEDTIAAMEEAESGKLKAYKSLKEMYADIGIPR